MVLSRPQPDGDSRTVRSDADGEGPRSDRAGRRPFAAATGAGILGSLAGCLSLFPGETDDDETDAFESNPIDDIAADPDDADSVDDLPLYDVHTHIIPVQSRGNDPLFVDELVDWMDRKGIDVANVLALDSPEAYPVAASSWWIVDEVATYPNRLIPFCTVDPRSLEYGEEPVEEVLESYLEAGARGFGELKAGVGIDDERADTLYELCANHDLPVLFHTDETAMTDTIGLSGLESVLESFPDVNFIAHAHGWWIHISDGVDTMDRTGAHDGPVEDGGRVPELLAEYDNIYGDISAGAGWDALSRDPEFTQEFFETHHEQLIFGTDYLFPDQHVPQFELFDNVELDLEAWADIRYRNAASLLR